MSKKSLLLLLFLYILSAGVTFGALQFAQKGKTGSTTQQTGINGSQQQPTANEGESPLTKLLTITPAEPRNEACPLNGKMFTAQEKAAWEKKRPLAVMIENSPDARPQSGMSSADVVFEAMAEGGVTRFMGLFYCNVQSADTPLAPIRSARTYFVDWASGFNLPLYVHVGGANTPGPADALGQIADYGWNQQNDMNQFSIGYPTFVRDYNRLANKEVATEHTMVTSTEKLWAVAAKRGWTNLSPTRTLGKKTTGGDEWKAGYVPWSFQDGKAGAGTVNAISFQFWDGYDTYGVKWDYDAATNSYKRTMASEPHLDLNTNQQIVVSNAVIMFADEKGPIDDKKHMLSRPNGTKNCANHN
jgi:hypothetical protein